MKPLRSRRLLTFVLALVLGVLFLVGPAAPAFGFLEDDPRASSSTNPWDPTVASTWWRYNWGNSLYPNISFGSVPEDPNPFPVSGQNLTIPTLGFMYRIDRLPRSVPSTAAGDPFEAISSQGGGPLLNNTFDLQGVLDHAPANQWGYVPVPGQSVPIEGRWYLHVRFFNYVRSQDGSPPADHYGVNIDVTPPQPVTNFTSGVTTVTPSKRRTFTWDNKEYDRLSGTAFFRILVNGVEKTLVPYLPSILPTTAVTIEDLPEGRNYVEIQAMDRALNLSAPVGEYELVDSAGAKIDITAPQSDGDILQGPYTFSADATDVVGIKDLRFVIDGTNVGTVTAPPYDLPYDTNLLKDGSHQLQIFADDLVGRFAQKTRFFSVSNHAPITPPPPVALESSPSVTMFGEDIMDPNYIWFTNSLAPTMQFSSKNASGLPETTGYYYIVDRSPSSVPTLDSDTTPRTSPLTSESLDMAGLAQKFPSARLHGESTAVEGDDWKIHVKSYIATKNGLSANTAVGHFGIDITKPAPVAGVTADVSGWTDVYRHRIQWVDRVYEKFGAGMYAYPFTKGYDALSGDKSWSLSVNGGDPIVWDRFTYAPFAAATIENGLHVGQNTVTVQVIDYAGNVSPPSNVYIYIDSDTPTLAIAQPAVNQLLAGSYTFKATARDGAGISKVTFKIDGVVKQATSSQNLIFDTNKLANGSHTLEVTARDMFGHTRTLIRSFRTDNALIRISGVSDAPDPFYPLIRDGIKDNMYMYFSLNKPATSVFIEIWDGNKRLIQGEWKGVRAGSLTATWNGRMPNGTGVWTPTGPAQSKTFYYRLLAVDAVGHWSITPKYPTTMRNYEVVYSGSNQVKIIPR